MSDTEKKVEKTEDGTEINFISTVSNLKIEEMNPKIENEKEEKEKKEEKEENHKNFTKKIILTLLCYNISSVNEKHSVEYKSPDKTKSNICINNCNTNNTSSISISSNMNHLNQKKIKRK